MFFHRVFTALAPRRGPAGLAAAALILAATGCERGQPSATRAEPDLAAHIAERIDVRESETIFTLFALLNAAGYDTETAADMHPVRKAVRGALPRLVPDAMFARAESFYKRHAGDAHPWGYSVVAMSTSGPPEFTPGPVWRDELSKRAEFARLAELPALLRDFHRAFRVDSVYAAHQTAYRVYIADYTTAIRREVAAAVRYARVESASELAGFGERNRSVVIPNLLQSFETAFSFVLGETYYAVEGPQPVVGFNPHEFIHAITNPLSYDTVRFRAAHQRAQAAYDAVRSRPRVAEFKTLAGFLDESLVRALALRYLVARQPARDAGAVADAAADADAGLVLVPYFYEQLARYEGQSESLREYYPRLFDALDSGRELARWPQH